MVTGGAGYIGSVLVERLIEEGHRPIVFDNLQTGHRAAVHPDARFFRGDVRNRADLDRAFGDYPCEATIHLAANSVVEESVNDPSKYFEVNVGGGINLLRAMLDHGVLRLIFSSTAAVYGEPDEVPIDETAATRPTNPYGVSKLMFERVLDAYADAYDLHFVALRYFNVFGPRQDPES
ncbi:MAG: NAD-dependent epimerase/dehydratase family protein, partial [Terriglobia bacterium]